MGTNFTNGATVVFGGTSLTTTFVSATQLTAVVPASLVAQAGTAGVTVVDPLGGVTSAVSFTIAVVAPLPPQQPPGLPTSARVHYHDARRSAGGGIPSRLISPHPAIDDRPFRRWSVHQPLPRSEEGGIESGSHVTNAANTQMRD